VYRRRQHLHASIMQWQQRTLASTRRATRGRSVAPRRGMRSAGGLRRQQFKLPRRCQDPDGTACTSDGNVCTLDECDGSNDACQHPAGNSGTGLPRLDGGMRPAGGLRRHQQRVSGRCQDASGTPCGSPSDTVCDDPDTCDGLGACQPNYDRQRSSARGNYGR